MISEKMSKCGKKMTYIREEITFSGVFTRALCLL